MNILMISGDKGIIDTRTAVHERMRAYARMVDELYIIVPSDAPQASIRRDNLFLYPAYSRKKIHQRIKMFRIAWSVARMHHFDVVTSQSPDELGLIAFFVARSRNVRLQLQVHTDILNPWYRRAGVIPYIKFLLARFLLRQADCVRVVSRRIEKSLEQQLGIKPAMITVLPICTPTKMFSRVVADENIKKRFNRYAFKMIAVGRFVDKEKNFSMLINLMARFVTICPNTVLVLVGDGPDKEMYQKDIHEHALENHVIIESWQDNLMNWYGAFDLFLLPSFIEGWGMVVIEAMAAGCAVVMTDVGLAGEVVQNDINGRVVAVGNTEQFLTAVIDLYEHPDKRTQLARAAQQSIEHLRFMNKEDYLTELRNGFLVCMQKF